VDAFAVEYYRTLCSGLPREIYNAAMWTPANVTDRELIDAGINTFQRASSATLFGQQVMPGFKPPAAAPSKAAATAAARR
jgi:hypothetical protein